MRRVTFFFLGLISGALGGVVASLLLAPASGNQMRINARLRFDELKDEAQLAAETRRAELERQLADLTRVPRD